MLYLSDPQYITIKPVLRQTNIHKFMESKDRKHKILITGTGRAGTTFLMELLTNLGIDTGFNIEDCHDSRYVSPYCHGGMEKKVTDNGYVIKSPSFCTEIPKLMTQCIIDHVFIPVRDMETAANSRTVRGNRWGGLLATSEPEKQKTVLLEIFGKLVSDLVLNDIPHSFLIFPRLALDVDYCFNALKPLFNKIETPISRETFTRIFNLISKPNLIHNYPSN